jgi:hypothetical protein
MGGVVGPFTFTQNLFQTKPPPKSTEAQGKELVGGSGVLFIPSFVHNPGKEVDGLCEWGLPHHKSITNLAPQKPLQLYVDHLRIVSMWWGGEGVHLILFPRVQVSPSPCHQGWTYTKKTQIKDIYCLQHHNHLRHHIEPLKKNSIWGENNLL